MAYAEETHILPQDAIEFETEAGKHYIGIGGTCTIHAETEKTDLIEATINVVTKTITGYKAEDYEAYDYNTWNMPEQTYKFENITELTFEGFYINENNRATIIELVNSQVFKLTKIPRRN